MILQVTAWVDGLGYEYSMVEGGAYRSYQARFRLQPGPDGTSVQWTLTYQPRGLFGALRDRFQGRRAQAAAMAASLRRLKHRSGSARRAYGGGNARALLDQGG